MTRLNIIESGSGLGLHNPRGINRKNQGTGDPFAVLGNECSNDDNNDKRCDSTKAENNDKRSVQVENTKTHDASNGVLVWQEGTEHALLLFVWHKLKETHK
jgi:hypothetical protein